MKLFKTLLTILFISLLSSPSWSQTMDDLVQREGLYYQKFTNVPFSGEITGQEQGSFKNGERDGAWVHYYENGQLLMKLNWKNGKRECASVHYRENGRLWAKSIFKDDKRECAAVYYHKNGQLSSKGNIKNGKHEGAWIHYHENGTVDEEKTGTFKNGKKIND